jgi:hypothetical protein
MNAAGAAFAAFAAYLIDFPPFVVLEAVWCVAALGKIGSIMRAQPEGRVDT